MLKLKLCYVKVVFLFRFVTAGCLFSYTVCQEDEICVNGKLIDSHFVNWRYRLLVLF